jgi:hypothetical protein
MKRKEMEASGRQEEEKEREYMYTNHRLEDR